MMDVLVVFHAPSRDSKNLQYITFVATLALGLQPRHRVVGLQAKREAQESCHMLPGMQESVRG
jgi:hypothetical protein